MGVRQKSRRARRTWCGRLGSWWEVRSPARSPLAAGGGILVIERQAAVAPWAVGEVGRWAVTKVVPMRMAEFERKKDDERREKKIDKEGKRKNRIGGVQCSLAANTSPLAASCPRHGYIQQSFDHVMTLDPAPVLFGFRNAYSLRWLVA